MESNIINNYSYILIIFWLLIQNKNILRNKNKKYFGLKNIVFAKLYLVGHIQKVIQ